MAGFADAFSADSVNKLMQDPRMLLGLQLMAQGRQGSGAQALGQAGSQAAQLLQQQQHSQQLAQYRQAQVQQAEQQRAFQMQQAQAKAEQQQRQQAAFADPNLQQSLGPISRQLAQAGLDPSLILKAQSGDALNAHRQQQLAQNQGQFDTRQQAAGAGGAGGGGGKPSGSKQPSPRQVLIEPLADGWQQKHIFDPATNSYKPYGQKYRQYAPGKAATGAEAVVDEVAPDPQADLGQLPGQGPLSSYAPHAAAQAPLMIAAGSNPHARSAASSAKRPARPQTEAEFKLLPSGALFIDPDDGKTYRKP